MPNLDEWKAEIVDAVKRGDRAAAKQAARSYLQRKQIESSVAKDAEGYGPIEMETVPFARGGTVQRPKHPAETAWAGAQSGVVNVGRRGLNMLTKTGNLLRGAPLQADMPEWASDQSIQEQSELDKPLLKTGEGMLGRIGGEVAATAPISGVGSRATQAVTSALPKAGPLLKGSLSLLGSAGEGALGSHLTTGDDAEGAAFGAGLDLLGKGLGKLGRGLKRTEGAERLLDAGLDLTPGQMNPEGILNQVEQAMDSIPVASQITKPVRKAAEDAVVPTLVGRAAKVPAGQIDDTMSRALGEFDKRYDLFKNVPAKRVDTTLIKDLTNAVKSPGVLAKDDTRQMVRNLVGSELTALKGKSAKGLSVGDWQQVRSRIRAAARSAEDNSAKELLDQIDDVITNHMHAGLGPTEQAAFKAIDQDYAKYKPWEKAYFRAGDREGGPTLKQATDALKRNIGESQWARGSGGADRQMLQDAREAFQNVSRPTGARILTVAAGTPAVVPATAFSLSPSARKWAQGRTGWQQSLKKAGKNPTVNAIVDLLRDTRGSQAAAFDRNDDEDQE